MPGPGISDDWLTFHPRIEVISTVKEHCLGVVVRDIFQDILAMNILQDSDSGISLVGLMNMIKARLIISPVAHLMKMTK